MHKTRKTLTNLLAELAILAFTGWAGAANATLVFTDVSHTSNSVTFTVNGDLSGYTIPSGDEHQFGLQYTGDLWAGSNAVSSNSWSQPVFDSTSFLNQGNTGLFTSIWGYTWSWYTSDSHSPQLLQIARSHLILATTI